MTRKQAATIAFVCREVGPARYLLALQQHLDAKILWCGSQVTVPLFEAERGTVTGLDYAITEANLVVSAVSVGEGIDKSAIRISRESGLPSIAIVEHWSWFRERFFVDGIPVLPDLILVNDSIALNLAIEAGLPPNILKVAGNPVLENLANSQPKRSREIKLAEQSKTVVFVSESLAAEKAVGLLPRMRFTEYDVLNAILRYRDPLDRVIVKLHPAENLTKYSHFGPDIEMLGQTSIQELAEISDVVIGLGSMLLLELAALGCPVINVEFNERDSFVGASIGATYPVQSLEEIEMLIAMPPQPSSTFVDSFVGSSSRIAQIFSEQLSR